MRINEVQPPELTKPALVQSFDIQPLFQFLQQLLAVCGTVFTVLLKLHDIAAHEPVAGSQSEVYSVCGCACNVLCIVLICFTNASKSIIAKVSLLWLKL